MGRRITGTPKSRLQITSEVNVGAIRPNPTPIVIPRNTSPVSSSDTEVDAASMRRHGRAKFGSSGFQCGHDFDSLCTRHGSISTTCDCRVKHIPSGCGTP